MDEKNLKEEENMENGNKEEDGKEIWSWGRHGIVEHALFILTLIVLLSVFHDGIIWGLQRMLRVLWCR